MPDYQSTHTGAQIDSAVDSVIPLLTRTSDPVSGTASLSETTVGILGQMCINTTTGKMFVCTVATSSYYAWSLKSSVKIDSTTPPQYAPAAGAITVGDFYWDSTNNVLYICTAANGISLTWTQVGSKVSGTNDGTNWTALTIDGVQKAIPQGGGGGTQWYRHTVVDNNGTLLKIYTPRNTEITSSLDLASLIGAHTYPWFIFNPLGTQILTRKGESGNNITLNGIGPSGSIETLTYTEPFTDSISPI